MAKTVPTKNKTANLLPSASTLRLFKAVIVAGPAPEGYKVDGAVHERTIPHGYIFDAAVFHRYDKSLRGLMELIEELYGVSAEKLNATFHKSWAKIKDTPMERLVVEQLAHYLTTYGAEQPAEYVAEKGGQWGVDNLGGKILALDDFESDRIREEGYVYIPKEKLEIPDLDLKGIRLVVIKGLTLAELKARLVALLGTGIALAEETIADILAIAELIDFTEAEVAAVKNKEARAALYALKNLVPCHPVEFLRYVLFKTTDSTLLIKNEKTIMDIKAGADFDTACLFKQYEKDHGLRRLAEVFHRYKPLFLAFRELKSLRPVINSIRRLAVKHHKPMPEDFLNTITAKLKAGTRVSTKRLQEELAKVNTFRKVRLAYALKYRTKNPKSIMYRIRNGKSYATDFVFQNQAPLQRVYEAVLASIVKDVYANVMGKKILIPDHIHYALPATEKQFTGHFPSGTYVTVEKELVFGINWKNVDGRQTDLDLSVISATGKTGWDAGYRNEGGSVLFSGDITNAGGKDGATELFYIRRRAKASWILFVNYYNYDADHPVPFKIIVGQENASELKRNRMLDPNSLAASVATTIDQKSKVLGLAVVTTKECRFYFAEAYLGGSITSSDSPYAKHSRQYLFDFYEGAIGLRAILEKAGAVMVDEAGDDVIDLSPEALEKDTILGLLK